MKRPRRSCTIKSNSPAAEKRQKKAEEDPSLAKFRPEKTDFKPLYTAHKALLEKEGVDVDAMVKIRRTIHMNAEGGFKEVMTGKLMKDTLLEFGVEEDDIHPCAGTGYFVDIRGTGPEKDLADGELKSVALRTDLDALPIPENNPHLDY